MSSLRLVWKGRTTIEMLRPKAEQQETKSLFSLSSPWTNFIFTLCKPSTPSYLMLYKRAREDKRDQNPLLG